MVKVVGVSFDGQKRIYFFDPNKLNNLNINTPVIVNTDRGMQYGVIKKEIMEISNSKLKEPLKKIVRVANKEDNKNYKKNQKDASFALKKCRDLIEKYNLNMKIISAGYTFNREQLLFYFLADSRIDFRNLAKELASIYKTRIELRQVGVRDKAKSVGGMGLCGCPLCCSRFLNEFDSVSINMAKNQNLSLNPSKINGACGSLLCCLKYEDEDYEMAKKNLPKIGKTIQTKHGTGKVVSIDIIKQTYDVEIDNNIVKVGTDESN